MLRSGDGNREGFSSLVTTLVINLDTRSDRWKRMKRVCRRSGIIPRRFSAHDAARGKETFPDSRLGPSEVGIWSSFVTAVQSEVDTPWLLILEDDALLRPGFRRAVHSYVETSSPDVATVRLGWLGHFAWRPGVSFPRYLFRMSRGILFNVWRKIRHRGRTRPEPQALPRFGAHAVLVRRAQIPLLLSSLGPAEIPLDVALLQAELSTPDVFTLSRRNLAWQWPSPSDIVGDRLTKRSQDT